MGSSTGAAATGLGRLKGKVAIVTGGGTGIGGGISRVFAREGAAVTIAEIDPAIGNRTVAEIRADGGRAIFVETDVSEEDQLRAAIDQTLGEFGGIDILVNNAGVGIAKTAEASAVEEWERLIGINVRSVFLTIKHVIPHMRARGGGSIINIGSMFALRAAPSYAIYHATKGAVRSLTKSTALAHAAEGIRVNAVHPGLIETPASTRDMAAQKIATANIGPMGRWGQPEEVAYGCLFLASDESKFVTGIDLPIDGGLSA
jgi:NAD(P)-dependent dehydrogenase (short-subunit alcohol dehydrogenase family)